jgi:hypothetical protein
VVEVADTLEAKVARDLQRGLTETASIRIALLDAGSTTCASGAARQKNY